MKKNSDIEDKTLRLNRWAVILPVAGLLGTGLIIMYGQIEGTVKSRVESQPYIQALLKERRNTVLTIETHISSRIMSLELRIAALEQVHLQCIYGSK